jgi:hypothetical protein
MTIAIIVVLAVVIALLVGRLLWVPSRYKNRGCRRTPPRRWRP